MKKIEGKTVVITGAGSGIGRALAIRCARAGARLALCDLDGEGLDETCGAVSAAGAEVIKEEVDVSRAGQLQAFAGAVRKAFGPADIIVNNAGVSLSETIERMKLEDFEWLMNINFWGVVHGTSAFLPQLRERPEAHVVNISSVFGLIGVPTQAAYNASKFAVRGYTETLRQELADSNIRVTSVHPGGVRTNIVRSGRHYTGVDGPTTAEALAEEFQRMARTTPEQAAEAILQGILRNKARVLIGADAHFIDIVQRLLPAHYDRVARFLMRLARSSKRRPVSPPAPSVLEPSAEDAPTRLRARP